MTICRLLTEGDEARLEAFLSTRPEESLLMLANLKRVGLKGGCEPYQGRYAAQFSGKRITAAAAHYWNGNLIVQAPEGMEALLEIVLADMTLPVRGFLGPADQVARARSLLGMEAAPVKIAEDQQLMVVEFADLVCPEALSQSGLRVRRARASECDLLANWRAALSVDALGAADSAGTLKAARQEADRHQREGNYWVLERGGQLVSSCTFSGEFGGLIQVGGVWTPAHQRGRGYARAAVAGALARAQADGARRACLIASNPAAIKAYRAIGFRTIGRYGLVLLGEERWVA